MDAPTDFFRQVIASLPPGTPFLIGQTPRGDVVTHIGPSGDLALSSQVGSAGTPGQPGSTPLELARALEAEHGLDHCLRVADWVSLLKPGVKGREIERAIQADVLKMQRKGKTRGGRARLITVRSMVEFLEVLEAVKRDPGVTPPWWSVVRKVA